MKRKIIVIVAIAAIMSFCLCACGSSSASLTGTWYKVCANPESAYDNVTFQSDGTFMSDVTGEYVQEGNTVRMNFLGLTTVEFDIVDYNGTDALLQKGKSVPYWCRTAEAAERAYNDAISAQ